MEKIRVERDLEQEQDVYGGRVDEELEALLGGGNGAGGQGGNA